MRVFMCLLKLEKLLTVFSIYAPRTAEGSRLYATMMSGMLMMLLIGWMVSCWMEGSCVFS